MSQEYLLVLCTCPEHSVAKQIAEALVSRHLAACVNIIPGITSVYFWKGKMEDGQEHLMLIKTASSHYTEVERCILEQHPYELPEVIAVPVQQGSDEYLTWIRECLISNP
ncbi:MAG: divalent-cation tolerance protein CutA [Methylococcaceae bacterium]|nr:divalent-cation tolerance protein CutA [Methylococcaceae bacterium]